MFDSPLKLKADLSGHPPEFTGETKDGMFSNFFSEWKLVNVPSVLVPSSVP
jgi:hypothetical protein